MGFDNECILNIQSLPGEYFCPVCRTLIYPNEALQSQCTHLYCKPCLAYVVATTHACPYDGYLVTEADSKPLNESNKSLAETIGKVAVHCLYHRSGCQWQGGLSECITHCTDCTFGNSPVLCNRCGVQIMHRQVQEHGQTCVGVQQVQQAETQVQVSTVQNQAVAPDQSSTATAVVATTAATSTAAVVAPASVLATAAAAPAQGQGQVMAQAPTPEQWYQQQQLQYQQYYQQYPGYDPYQQQYQQYAQYQQQVHPQYQQPQMPVAPQYPQHQAPVAPQQAIQGQQQPLPYLAPQPQPQPQLQPQPHPQPQPQVQPQPMQQHPPQLQPQPHLQPQPRPHVQHPQMQAPQVHLPLQQPRPQVSQLAGQQLVQAQPHQQVQPPQNQLPLQPQPHPLHPNTQAQPHQQHQPHVHPLPNPQPQTQQHHMPLQPHHQSQPSTQPQLHPVPHQQMQHQPVHAVSGHQSYPQLQHPQQIPPNGPQQHPMHPHPLQQGMPPQQPQHPIQAQNQIPSQHPTPHAQSMMPPHVQPQAQPMVHPQGQQIHQHHPGMQPHPQQHGLLQQQTHANLQMSQHGVMPSQQIMHPQHSARPQGPPYMQQQQQHISQAGAVRPMLSHGTPQQPSQHLPDDPAKLKQPGVNQQAGNQSYTPRGTHQPGSMQQSQLSHSASRNSLVPASPVPQSRVVAHPIASAHASLSSLDSMADAKSEKAGSVFGSEAGPPAKKAPGIETGDLVNAQAEGSESAELRMRKPDSGEACLEKKESNIQTNGDDKDVSESAEGHGKDFDAHAEEQVLKSIKAEDATEEVIKSSNGSKAAEGDKGNLSLEAERHDQLGGRVDGENLNIPDGTGEVQHISDSINVKKVETLVSHEKTNQTLVPKSLIAGNASGNMHAPPQHMQLPGNLEQGNLHQKPHQQQQPHLVAHERPFPQHGHHVAPPGSDVSGKERYPPQQMAYGHPPNMLNPTGISHRPPAQDKMFPPNVPPQGPSQERMFQEPPHQFQEPPHQMQSQMRPPVHNFHEPNQWQPSMPPPIARQPYEAPHHGLPGQNQTYMPPSHGAGAMNFQGGPMARPELTGPPPGPSGMMARQQPIGPEDHRAWAHPVTAPGAETYPVKQPSFFDGRQHEPHHSAPHVQSNAMVMNGIPSKGPVGGMHDSGFPQGFREERLRPIPEEGFKATQSEPFRPSSLNPGSHIVNRLQFEEDLKQFPRPDHLNAESVPKFDGYMPLSRPIDRGSQAFGHDTVPRPINRGSLEPDRGPGNLTSWPLPTYQSSASFPSRSSGLGPHPMDIGERQWPVGPHEDLGRKQNLAAAHPDRIRPINDFDHPRMDSFPSLRSPAGEQTGFTSNRFGPRKEDFHSGEPHGFGERFNARLPLGSGGGAFHESNLPIAPGPGLPGPPGHMGKDMNGPEMLPNLPGSEFGSRDNLRVGESRIQARSREGEPTGFPPFQSHLRTGDLVGPGNLPSNVRIGEQIRGGRINTDFPNESGYFGSVSLHGDMEYSKMRRPGSMGFCRICKIECESVDGLDQHSQTREHQRTAMDMVLSIKRENMKQKRLNSEGNVPLEDGSKMKKPNFESRRP